MMAVDYSISAHTVKMVSSDVRITGAVARQNGLRRRFQLKLTAWLVLGFVSSDSVGLKCRSQVRSQVTGHRSQVTGHRSNTKTIGHWTKLFWTDVLLYKNKKSQETLMIFLSFKQY